MQRKIISIIAFAAATLFLAAFAAAGGEKNEALAGRSAFEKRCTGCHALDHEKTGPRLAGVVGRRAGAVPAFPYSDAIKNAGLVWNETNLDKWLTDPGALIPDNDMTFRLDSSSERAAIIAYLKNTSK